MKANCNMFRPVKFNAGDLKNHPVNAIEERSGKPVRCKFPENN
jgi:hypothetical protein